MLGILKAMFFGGEGGVAGKEKSTEVTGWGMHEVGKVSLMHARTTGRDLKAGKQPCHLTTHCTQPVPGTRERRLVLGSSIQNNSSGSPPDLGNWEDLWTCGAEITLDDAR